jgi:hypothetical protein
VVRLGAVGAAVRAMHLWEVGITNFLFGGLSAWLLARRGRGTTSVPTAAAADTGRAAAQ